MALEPPSFDSSAGSAMVPPRTARPRADNRPLSACRSPPSRGAEAPIDTNRLAPHPSPDDPSKRGSGGAGRWHLPAGSVAVSPGGNNRPRGTRRQDSPGQYITREVIREGQGVDRRMTGRSRVAGNRQFLDYLTIRASRPSAPFEAIRPSRHTIQPLVPTKHTTANTVNA